MRTFWMDARIPGLWLSTCISRATVSNWGRSYCEECENNDEDKSKLEMLEELRRRRYEKAKSEKENSFLK